MACLKCGSQWVTRKGNDMASCPECCRLQRRKARKQGRLPATLELACKRCGEAFTAEGSAMATAAYCKRCRPLARNERIQQWKQDVAAGVRQTIPQGKRCKGRPCLKCGKTLKHHQPKYCSRACFFAARNDGRQSWDRTRQLESVWHRGGRWANAPSTKYIGVLNDAMQSVLKGWDEFCNRLSQTPVSACEMCGAATYGPAARFCSIACLAKSEKVVSCCKCGKPTLIRGVGLRKLCEECRAEIERLFRKRYKKEKGTYRKRCRKYGGYYNAEVTRSKVFERDGYVCHVCHKKAKRRWANNHPMEATLDHHPIPLSRGGDHDWHNVRCAHRKCNSEKSDKWDGQRRLVLTD